MNPVPAEPGRPIGMDSIERPIGRVRGTRDWLPHDFARLAALERLLLEQFRRGLRADADADPRVRGIA